MSDAKEAKSTYQVHLQDLKLKDDWPAGATDPRKDRHSHVFVFCLEAFEDQECTGCNCDTGERALARWVELNHDALCRCCQDKTEAFSDAIEDKLDTFDSREEMERWIKENHGKLCKCGWDGLLDPLSKQVTLCKVKF